MSESAIKIQDFTDLTAWKKAHALVLRVYQATKHFPASEQFALTNQITRAAVSITSNIAEGFGRNSGKDKMQFYSIAKGSLLEVRSQLHVAKDLGYITQAQFEELERDAVEVVRIIAGLIRSAPKR